MGPYLIPWDKADIGPRIGIAYNIYEKTVIRAAYGIFYGGEENQGGNPNRGESAPFNESPQLGRPSGVNSFDPNPFCGWSATGGIAAGYPVNVFTTFPVTSLQFRAVATDFRNPEVQKWNFAVQHELPAKWLWRWDIKAITRPTSFSSPISMLARTSELRTPASTAIAFACIPTLTVFREQQPSGMETTRR